MPTDMMTTSLDDSGLLPCRRENVVENELDGEAILFNPANGATHRLNETALAVWRQCDGRRSTRQMAEFLIDAYEVDPDIALQDVEQLVVVFAEADLLEISSE